MLRFSKDGDNFVVEESIHGFSYTHRTRVEYLYDLSYKRIGDGPWRKTTANDREWFTTNYLNSFTEA